MSHPDIYLKKNPNVLVLGGDYSSEYHLVNRSSGISIHLPSASVQKIWFNLRSDIQERLMEHTATQILVRHGFLSESKLCERFQQHHSADGLIPIVTPNVKFIWQNRDMCVLFNTQTMRPNNPLLVLSPYGTLCWKEIEHGSSIGRIRSLLKSEFGTDEVLGFLKRLSSLGFIDQLPQIADSDCGNDTIIKEFPAPEVQFALPYTNLPWYCLWEITRKCDLRCDSCYLDSFSAKSPSTNEVLRIARSLIDAGIFYITIMGGEPLLIPEIGKVINLLRSNGIFVKLISNGQSLTQPMANELHSAGLNMIEISLDGVYEKSHDRCRGIGTFSRAMEAINIAQNSGIPRIGLVFTLYAENFSEVFEMPLFLDNINLKECYISLFKQTGIRGGCSSNSPPSSSQIEELNSTISVWALERPDLSITLLPKCTCGRSSVVISPEGKLRPCPFSKRHYGDLKKSSFSEIWRAIINQLPESGGLGYCTEKGLVL
jgi:MoaA/NifB/PqqE/SkfB family radical SAM enzyme